MEIEEQKLPFHYKDKQLMENLLKDVNLAIKDSDASEEKKIVNNFLRKVSEAFLFVTIGSSGVGKSTFLNGLFRSALSEKEVPESTKSIREYRYGVSEASIRVNEHITRIFKSRSELEGLQIIDTQGIDQMGQGGDLDCIKDYLRKSSVVFALFDVRSVKDYAVWELLEDIETRKVVFVLTKCDLEEAGVVEQRENKLRQYMEEAGLHAPVFRLSTRWEDSFEAVREYASREVIGSNPILTRQQENLDELKKMLSQLLESFNRRRQQYESDAAILQNINTAIDNFILNNRVKIDDLKMALKREIEREIEAYEKEVINKLEPQKIKERFPNGSRDFEDYLNLINEGYRKRMTDNVNRKTQMTVQTYLAGLESVFEEATGYLNKRENILALKDKFYGSMADSKKSIVYKARTDMEVTKDYYHSIYDISTELFIKLWKARQEREQAVQNAKLAGTAIGSLGGAAAGMAAAYALAPAVAAIMGKGAIAAVVTSAGSVLWPVVGVVLGALVIRHIAKQLASANTLPELEKKTAEAIREFKKEVAKAKESMTEQILETIENMFRMEIENADKSFSEFRMSINIEGNNVARLEERFDTINGYLLQIKELERRRELAL